ncbi:hypothetical protein GCM10008957_16960 [Deinococcus ruber]|uniref:Uncharacterized protein n=1 Tax=Deinococcus ruber TaxID=1848197 RepID=A0A918C4P7_9DEIO|nr:hypothetical protein GCM10008957_16960 [Deinococcus ruber]
MIGYMVPPGGPVPEMQGRQTAKGGKGSKQRCLLAGIRGVRKLEKALEFTR